MKKTLLAISLLITVVAVSRAQNPDDIMKYLKSGDVKKAKEIADQCVASLALKNDAKSWFYHAVTYHTIYESESADIRKLDNNALTTAYNSYKKTMENDPAKEYNSEIMKALGVLANQMVYEGVQVFNAGNYTSALLFFETNIEIGKLPAFNALDTIVLYNAALSAEKTGNEEKAAKYYKELTMMGFGGSRVYLDLARTYKRLGNTSEYLKTLEIGLKMCPDEDIDLYSELVNYQLETGANDQALATLEICLKKQPGNAGYQFVKGSLLDQKGDTEGAEKAYLAALEIDPVFQDVLFNLGILYFNAGTDLLKKATGKADQTKGFELYRKAMPHLEKLLEVGPEDVQVMKVLQSIYNVLKETEKEKAILQKLENHK